MFQNFLCLFILHQGGVYQLTFLSKSDPDLMPVDQTSKKITYKKIENELKTWMNLQVRARKWPENGYRDVNNDCFDCSTDTPDIRPER